LQELKDYTRPDEAASTPAAPQHSFDEQAVRELSFEIGKLRRWHFWAGPFLTTLVGGALMLLSEHVPSLRPGIVLVLPVLYSIFTGGLISGVVSAAIAAIAINFSYPSHTLLPSAESWPYMLWDMGGLTLVLFAGERLRRSSYRARLSDKLNRQLRYEVHERQRIEDELRLQRDNFEDTIENCAQPMHWVGPDGTILWANQAELDLLGYAQHEYVGHNIADFHAEKEKTRADR